MTRSGTRESSVSVPDSETIATESIDRARTTVLKDNIWEKCCYATLHSIKEGTKGRYGDEE